MIDKSTFTRQLVIESGVFGICIPGAALADLTYSVGSCTGREDDKFSRFGLDATTGPALGVPLVEAGCAAWLECRLIPEPHTQDAYDTCFGEVLAAAADARIFERGRWSFRDDNTTLQTIHHLGAGHFVHAGRALPARRLDERRG